MNKTHQTIMKIEMKKLSAYAGCLLALCLASCKENETSAAQPTFSLVGNPTTLTAPWEGITQSYDVETNYEWKAAVDVSWLTVTPNHSANNGAIKVKVAQTSSNMQRTGSINFTVDGETLLTLAVKQDGVTLQGIELTPTSLALELGEMLKVVAKTIPDNSTSRQFTWTSNNTAVATVSGAGLVTGVGVGQTSITVSTTDGVLTGALTTELPVQVLDGPDEPSGEQMPIMTWYGPFPVSGETERHF
ncbi:MAG: Ig-like domain-containing protein, partial [Prevotellaceae bacterium]|nr:Ig-like domain-containing protein [Prevotellaceae bacterium]